ncbi:hypothetical protein RhiirA1_489261 [Rhizophagus irregularis]|uniref:Uncharacterized protein n=2 Tax=Rhizophagus irregularis TaxID=588596 RepID=A0A2N0SK61_9GLOM|nr:hypothetical protein RhiirA1_489261 [Rhizophagus irregularis]CAB4486060.1 unnamed protein product [Rhizophagus irregularis]
MQPLYDNVISDQPLMSNTNYQQHSNINYSNYSNNVTTSSDQQLNISSPNNGIFDQQVTVSDQQYQPFNIASPNHNHQQQYQYIHQPGIPNNTTITPDNNYQQPMSNNNVTISADNNHHASNNIPHNNNQQQSNVSPPQQNQPSDSSQSNILPLLNSFGINISSPQATIIIMPTTNSDIQNQLQQVLAYLNRSQQ